MNHRIYGLKQALCDRTCALTESPATPTNKERKQDLKTTPTHMKDDWKKIFSFEEVT
jgi:hypothetical protein